MKKLLIISNLFMLSLIMFISCKKDKLNTTSSTTSEAGLHGKGSHDANREECPKCFNHSTTPFEGVNATTAWTISNNYKTINQPLLEINGVGPDANSIWFSMESLKNFIWKVEEAVCEKRCPNGINLGIRLYYARYPEQLTNDLAGLNPDFAQRHTIFMVPTFQESPDSQIHWDFDPWHWGTDGCKPRSMTEWFATGPKPFGSENSLVFSIGESQYFTDGYGNLTSALNHGGLIPPYPMTGAAY